MTRTEAASVLDQTPTLGGHDQSFGDTRLAEITSLALVSIALPQGGDQAAIKALKSAFKLDLPAPGQSTASKTHRLIRTAPDQALLAFDHPAPDAEALVAKALKGTVYTTDQTGAWVTLDLSGPATHAALERICPLDLHDSAFPLNAAARTVMEHMGAIIIRTGPDSFRLMSASSSAMSFLHAIESSIRYVS